MTKALILAAGQGTRLRPITNDRPKCLVPLAGVTLLERQVATLKSCGVKDIHIATGYRADQIKAMGFETSFNARFEKTNMVESLFSAVDFIKNCNEDLILAYGDIVYNEENLKLLLNSNAEVSLMIDKGWHSLWSLRLENPLDDAETLVMNCENYITEIGEKPENYEKIHGQYTGLIKIREDKLIALIEFYEALDRHAVYDSKDFDNMYMTSFIQLMIDSGWGVKATIVENGWLEIDSVEDLAIYEKCIEEGTLENFYKV